MRRISRLKGTAQVPAAAVRSAFLAILLTCLLTLTVVDKSQQAVLTALLPIPAVQMSPVRPHAG